jgi:phosphate starvation-inducible PhoH-like protein
VDLPKNQLSGLIQVQGVLQGVEGIDFIYLDDTDIVRHKLVGRIIRAYSKE